MQRVQLSELDIVAGGVLQSLSSSRDKSHATLIALRGDLGAGKTTFVQALAKGLGVAETVHSPTYMLMKKYKIPSSTFSTLVHIDAYRLESQEQFAALKPEQFLRDPKNLVVVEWPKNIEGALPAPDLTISFSSDGAKEGERYIEVHEG
jgi:tRNA threonylcarbamoyladenosine biosynthesis protein TsaE